ncbi:MAG: phosphoribosylanthranilate isomerase [Acidimicrobiia bacterium]
MTGDVKVQIYTMQSAAEAVAIGSLGVDHVGVTPSNLGLPGEIEYSLAADICRRVVGVATSVALSVDSDPDGITEMVRAVTPDILHLCGPPGAVGPSAVANLRRDLPGVGIMQAIAVTGPEAIDVARSYEDVVDFLLLDSVDPGIPGVGASGAVHDWTLSAEIVEAVSTPVVLAGGLSPENVAEAITIVNPWGVDSLTHTNRALDQGGFRKDPELVSRFVAAARSETQS